MLHKTRKLREIKASGFFVCLRFSSENRAKKGKMCTECVPDFLLSDLMTLFQKMCTECVPARRRL